MNDIEKQLQAPFSPKQIEWRITAKTKDDAKGLVAAYVTNRAIQDRLDEVMGCENWKNEFISLGEKSKICGLSLRFNGEWVTKYDGASDTNIEATKGGLSGAMKRAAVQWGIGRYLYKLPSQWVKIKAEGRSYKVAETPKLPDWALPETERKEEPKTWDLPKEESANELPPEIENCVNAFKNLGISKADLENYLHLEAWMFQKEDIETLRNVYQQIAKKEKQKEDFFFENKRKSDKLEKELNK